MGSVVGRGRVGAGAGFRPIPFPFGCAPEPDTTKIVSRTPGCSSFGQHQCPKKKLTDISSIHFSRQSTTACSLKRPENRVAEGIIKAQDVPHIPLSGKSRSITGKVGVLPTQRLAVHFFPFAATCISQAPHHRARSQHFIPQIAPSARDRELSC